MWPATKYQRTNEMFITVKVRSVVLLWMSSCINLCSTELGAAPKSIMDSFDLDAVSRTIVVLTNVSSIISFMNLWLKSLFSSKADGLLKCTEICPVQILEVASFLKSPMFLKVEKKRNSEWATTQRGNSRTDETLRVDCWCTTQSTFIQSTRIKLTTLLFIMCNLWNIIMKNNLDIL